MKTYRSASDVQHDAGVTPAEEQTGPQSNAARISELGLGGGGGGAQDQGPSEEGESHANHDGHGHEDVGGDELIHVGIHRLSLGTINMLVDYVYNLEEIKDLLKRELTEGLALIEITEQGKELTAQQKDRFAISFLTTRTSRSATPTTSPRPRTAATPPAHETM